MLPSSVRHVVDHFPFTSNPSNHKMKTSVAKAFKNSSITQYFN
jgi:hypothetical protein